MVTDDNSLYGWGENSLHQLGLGTLDTTDRNIPTKITNIIVGTISSLYTTTGGRSAFAITSTGTVYAWGKNDNGKKKKPFINSFKRNVW